MSRREFHFSEGSSHKFWAIEVSGKRFTVQFGRIGTAGQTQTKDFASPAAAQQAADKLIAEKTKKGYAEVTAGAATPAAPAAPRKGKAPSAEAEAVKPAASAAPVVTHELDVEPPDWLRVPGQPWQARERPEPQPFDLADCVKRLGQVTTVYGWTWQWAKARIAPALVLEEAHFWFRAMTEATANIKPADLAKELAKGKYTGKLSLAQLTRAIKEAKGNVGPDTVLPLANLLPPEDIVRMTLDESLVDQGNWSIPFQMTDGFFRHVLPYLTEEQARALWPVVREYLDGAKGIIPWGFAAFLGMHADLRKYIAGWSDGQCKQGHYVHGLTGTHLLLFTLGDAALVEKEMRRVGLPLMEPDHVRAWLTLTRFEALGYVRDAILTAFQKDAAERMLKVFVGVKAPEVAPHMLQLKLESKVPALARQWLDDHAGNAIAGLVPVAAGQGKLAAAAVEYLREAKRRGLGAFIEEQLKGAAPEVAAAVRQQVLEHVEKVYPPLDDKTTPPWLRGATAAAKGPDWARPSNLPPLLVGERCLTEDQMRAVLSALRQSTFEAVQPLVREVKQHAEPASREAFVWKLFELWLAEGAPAKEKWAFMALGLLGGDASVLRVTPLIRAWPGESQHARAVLGLECLRAVGSDTALIQLNGIAQKLKFKGLQNRAKELMEQIAKDRGLTRTQLEDRIVPDLDLDERGTRIFDFGPRQFRMVLGADLKPLVRDADGKLKEDLPKPGTKDDATKAAAAVEGWKLLKKQLREALKVQVRRLEQAMVTGRRWPVEEFELLLVRQPLMVNLVRRLLWGGYDKKGELKQTFRVTEEQEYAGADDRPCALGGVAAVGIVHPLHLTADQRAKWGEVFGDYEIIAPFAQLGRPVFGLEPGEAKEKEIMRLKGVKIPPGALLGTMEALGWTRGSADNHGVIMEFCKPFPFADVTALIENEPGVMLGLMSYTQEQEVKRCFFLEGTYKPLSYPHHTKLLPLKDIDPLALSETLADLAMLGSKGK